MAILFLFSIIDAIINFAQFINININESTRYEIVIWKLYRIFIRNKSAFFFYNYIYIIKSKY